MWRRLAIVVPILIFASGVLLTSVLRTAAVKYDINDGINSPSEVLGEKDINIDYQLPFPGRVLPDSPLWILKATRDKLWLALTTNPSRKAELKLLFADKRLGSARILFEKGKPEIALSTLTKAEKYLEEASREERQNRQKGIDTSEFLLRISKASLKHYELIQEILREAPEGARPKIVQYQNYAKRAYEEARNAQLERGNKPFENPFNW